MVGESGRFPSTGKGFKFLFPLFVFLSMFKVSFEFCHNVSSNEERTEILIPNFCMIGDKFAKSIYVLSLYPILLGVENPIKASWKKSLCP